MLVIYRDILGGPILDIVPYDIDGKYQTVHTCGEHLMIFNAKITGPEGVKYRPANLGVIVVQYKQGVKEL